MHRSCGLKRIVAAPDASLRFLFYGGVVVLPVIAAYTIGVYWVFRGKIGKVAGNP